MKIFSRFFCTYIKRGWINRTFPRIKVVKIVGIIFIFCNKNRLIDSFKWACIVISHDKNWINFFLAHPAP